MVFRPAVWIPISRTVFRKGVGGTVFSLEDDKHPFLDARGIHLLFPVEAMFRSDSKEFKIRYVHWENYTTNGLSGGPPLLNFGGVDFSGRVSARLQTDVLGLDFHQNLWNSPSMGLYLMAGGDLFSTNLELSGSAGSKSLREALPILTVGLGLRFKVKRTADVTMSSSALSYSQLLGMRERFFGADDVYRNAEISVEWEFRPRLHLGAGWKHYEVSFQDEAAKASQEYRGRVFWALCRF